MASRSSMLDNIRCQQTIVIFIPNPSPKTKRRFLVTFELSVQQQGAWQRARTLETGQPCCFMWSNTHHPMQHNV